MLASVTGPREMREVCPNLESSSTKQMVSDFWVAASLVSRSMGSLWEKPLARDMPEAAINALVML